MRLPVLRPRAVTARPVWAGRGRAGVADLPRVSESLAGPDPRVKAVHNPPGQRPSRAVNPTRGIENCDRLVMPQSVNRGQVTHGSVICCVTLEFHQDTPNTFRLIVRVEDPPCSMKTPPARRRESSGCQRTEPR